MSVEQIITTLINDTLEKITKLTLDRLPLNSSLLKIGLRFLTGLSFARLPLKLFLAMGVE